MGWMKASDQSRPCNVFGGYSCAWKVLHVLILYSQHPRSSRPLIQVNMDRENDMPCDDKLSCEPP